MANFNDFSGGTADSILRGIKGSFAVLVGCNIHDVPGQITVNQALAPESSYTITELCKNVVTASDGNTYFFSSESGKIWKRTSTGEGSLGVYTLVHTNTKGANLGAREYNGYIYYVGAGFLGRQTVALAASEASWSSQSDSYQTLTVGDTVFAPMEEVNDILYIGNGKYLASFDGTTYDDDALILPSQYRVSTLAPFGIDILIGTYVGTGTTNLVKINYCRLFRWSTTVGERWNNSDVVYECGINAFIPMDNQILVQAGIAGNIYYYDGSQLIPYKKIPGTYSSTQYGLVYSNATGIYKGLSLIGFSNSPDTANSTGNPASCGVYSIGRHNKNYPLVMNLEFPVSSVSPLSSVIIGCIASIGNTILASWKKKSTITVITIATPGVVTLTSHGLTNGSAIVFATSGALPTGITAGTTYYTRSVTADTLHLYDTAAHAIDTGATTGRVNTSGTQSGAHTASTFGVDALSASAKYASAYLETLVLADENFDKKFVEFYAGYVSMPTNCSITFSYKKNYASSYTDISGAETESNQGVIYKRENLFDVRAIQMKISFTVSANNSPVLDYFGVR